MSKPRSDALKDALIDEAFKVVEEKGVENLSLREVARRLGVSHQAPYKHFASRDHILAAVVARCFRSFSDALEARPRSAAPFEDLAHMGQAYLDFAKAHPLKYRLMFNTPLPASADHPEMLAEAEHAFALLRDRLDGLPLRDPEHPVADSARHDAIFVWSALHGIASLLQSDVTATIGLDEVEGRLAVERLMRRLSMAIEP